MKSKDFLESNLFWKTISSLSVLFIISLYIWLITVGKWTEWRETSTYYDLLATAFRHGQLSLELQPDPALLALPNPYDPASRSGINWLGDASLYNGKYYLYFGPTPALIGAIIKLFFPITIEDGTILFVFTTGTFLFLYLLASRIWNKFFNNLPKWTLQLCIFFLGLASPFTIMLLTAGVYQAAIASGQFFLIGGIYFAFTSLDRADASKIRLALTGLFLTLAAGSRSTLAIAVIFIATLTAVWVFKNQHRTSTRMDIIKSLTALFAPLCIGAILLGWYNWARFGSVTEFGFYYALTTNNLQKIRANIFSPLYILQNLYNYLLNSYAVSPIFPVLKILDGKYASVVPFIAFPKVYFTEGMTGILLSFPFNLFSLIAISKLFHSHRANGIKHPDLSRWTLIAVSGTFFFGFAPLLAFFWVAFRYMADFYPALSLLSAIGFWEGYRLFQQRKALLILYSIFGIILATTSIIITLMLTISNGHGHIKYVNPELLQQLKDLYWAVGFRPK